MSYSVKVPHAVAAIPEHELDRRVVFTLDQCVIDRRAFYLRGRIPVPVTGQAEPFIWGVWARVGSRILSAQMSYGRSKAVRRRHPVGDG
jgi:hypothetical protein